MLTTKMQRSFWCRSAGQKQRANYLWVKANNYAQEIDARLQAL